ncbi:vp91 [Venturia canescens]|uniref:Vp91 n=1 Tax=Venturia canescens TaxID=32260 RepID=A0ACB9ZJ04_9HYME|nr:uncharacterized LOC122408848 [Venturia canescens]KAI5630621.1 vp91 [Venturia canescens]
MDLFFTIFIVLLIILLLIAYMLNRVPRTHDLIQLLDLVREEKPMATAFSLGSVRYTSKKNRYLNIYWDGDKITQKLQTRPVNSDGSYVFRTNHGRIIEYSDGFTITGMEKVFFKCPAGYKNFNCQLESPCTMEEHKNEASKGLTYTMFNALDVYQHSLMDVPVNSDKDVSSLEKHPRIRIQCLKDGNYELVTCPNNKVLDPVSLKCQPYDICEDRINGYKHNYSKDGKELEPGHYLICEENVGKDMECAKNTSFSMSQQGCITQSKCYGRGSDQIWEKSDTFIQCKNDREFRKYCEHGIDMDDNGIMNCHKINCFPNEIEEESKLLEYYTKGKKCTNDDRPIRVICTKKKVNKIYQHEWIEKFKIVVEGWPDRIMNKTTYECMTPDDSIYKKDATELVRYTDIMSQSYPYDLKRETFKCKTRYVWDYKIGKIFETLTRKDAGDIILDSASPCQYKIYEKPDRIPIWGFGERFPIKTSGKAPAVYRVSFIQEKTFDIPYRMWPTYNWKTKVYYATTVCYDFTNRKFVCDTFTDIVPPVGFALADSATKKDQQLYLRGYPDFPKKNEHNDYMWYFIASGETEPVRFRPSAKRETTRYACPQSIDTTSMKNGTTAFVFIMWDNILGSNFVELTPGFIIKRREIIVSGKSASISFQPVMIEKLKTKTTLKYMNLSITLPRDGVLKFP